MMAVDPEATKARFAVGLAGLEQNTNVNKLNIQFETTDGFISNNNNFESGLRKCQSAAVLTPPPFDCHVSACPDDEPHQTLAEKREEMERTEAAELREKLQKIQEQLKRKEEECKNLTDVQLQTGQEVEELTASLFEEANKMVQDAHTKRISAEKSLVEANAKIEVLQAEVTALKALVLTSTPSKPNVHLNPQIDKTKKTEFTKGHRRSTSHHNIVKVVTPAVHDNVKDEASPAVAKVDQSEEFQVEPSFLSVFHSWRETPSLDATLPFVSRIIQEDVVPCLNFSNVELSKLVYDGILSNTVTVEPLSALQPANHQQCVLTQMEPSYSIKLGDLQTPFAISKMARNRIISVCDFVTYMRYILQGLVKSKENEVFVEITQLRKKMSLARLGLLD